MLPVLVTDLLDYSTVYIGLWKHQLAQNTTVRVLTGIDDRGHVSPVLAYYTDFQLVPHFQIQFSIPDKMLIFFF